MPDAPADPAPRGAPGPPGSGPPSGRDRSPGWQEVLLLAGVILVAVFALEIASALLPPVREAFQGFPVTIAVLVAGTVGFLVLGVVRRPPR